MYFTLKLKIREFNSDAYILRFTCTIGDLRQYLTAVPDVNLELFLLVLILAVIQKQINETRG